MIYKNMNPASLLAKKRWEKDKMTKEERSKYFKELAAKRKKPGRKKTNNLNN